MNDICLRENCTGCSACFNICSVNAIDMISDDTGFTYPNINIDVCINCSKCIDVCPHNKVSDFNTPGEFYAGVSFNDKVKEASSSGGIFSLLAENIIKNGGVVFGAAFDENLKLKHIAVKTTEELYRLRGSKYVQSDIGDCFSQVKELLKAGRKVLFSGTPCQLDGLHSYLSGKSENLYTVDVLCHGVPSPEIFRRYILFESELKGDKAIAIDFRSKNTGWLKFSTNIKFADGVNKMMYRSGYMLGFLNNYYLRECCYSCKYARLQRVGDITLGDFWGYKETTPAYLEDDDRGISLVIVNNEKGKKLIKGIKKQAAFVYKSYDEAVKGNPILNTPSKRPVDYDDFQKDYRLLSWSELSQKYFTEIPEAPTTSTAAKDYISVPFKKRYYKHLIYCKKQDFINKIKKGK